MKNSIKLLALIPLLGFAFGANANTETKYDSTSTTTTNDYSDTEDTTVSPTGTSSSTTTTTKSTSPTVMDQSAGSEKDVEITRTIRENLGNSGSLSTSAKNIEVITLNNTITLRGTVASQAEKNEAARIAQGAAGSHAVRNELTVDTSKR